MKAQYQTIHDYSTRIMSIKFTSLNDNQFPETYYVSRFYLEYLLSTKKTQSKVIQAKLH